MAWSIEMLTMHKDPELGSLLKQDVWLHPLTYTLFFQPYTTQSMVRTAESGPRDRYAETKKPKEIGREPEETVIMRQENPWSLVTSQPSQLIPSQINKRWT